MEPERPVVTVDVSAFLAFVGIVAGSILAFLGSISFGLQLVAVPVGAALIFLGALRKHSRIALAYAGGSIGIALASYLSYSFGLAQTIFQPNLLLLAGSVVLLTFLGHLAGRRIEEARRGRSEP